MQTQPDLSGLPFWAQLLITVLVGVGTLGIAFKGYFTKGRSNSVVPGDQQTAAVMAATIADMGAIRHLSEVCIQLTGAVDRLTEQLQENEHHQRISTDLEKEIAARLREGREVIERELSTRLRELTRAVEMLTAAGG